MSKQVVLVVEDERDILDVVEFNLRQAGYDVLKAQDGLEGLRLAQEKHPDLLVLDLLLPGLDGKEVCRRLKRGEVTSALPVLMLTALASETDRVIGFEIGADDYLTKPFSPRELVLRVGAILRRLGQPQADQPRLTLGRLNMDLERRQALVDDQVLDLTATEFKLLHRLASLAGRVQTRESLLEQVWGYSYQGYSRTVDTHVRRLRAKLGPLSDHLETVRGMGYRWHEEI